MASGSSQPEFPTKACEAAGVSPSAPLPSAPPPYSIQPYPGHYNTDPYGKPSGPSVGYWQPQQLGYTGLPHTEILLTRVPISQGVPTAVLVPHNAEQIVIVRERESFVKQIILSCVVFWVCCWPLGLVALILAIMANGSARATDEASATKAHRLGVHSCRTSIAGLVIGVIIIIVYIILKST